jgi:hypothetical protein
VPVVACRGAVRPALLLSGLSRVPDSWNRVSECGTARPATWRITIDLLRREGGGPIEEHKDEWYMLTEGSMNFYTAGTVNYQ